MSLYHVTEPHPSVNTTKKSAYILSGRGGAGNINRYTTTSLTVGPAATGPASQAALPAPPTSARAMLTGRGGAGNAVRPTSTATAVSAASAGKARVSSESSGAASNPRLSSTSSHPVAPPPPQQHAIFSFDEELQRDQRMLDNAARATLIGRGGAGNAFHSGFGDAAVGKRGSNASVRSAASASSSGSEERPRSKGLTGVMGRLSRTISRS